MKKIISIVIALLMITAVLASCGAGGGSTSNYSKAEASAAPMPDSAPQEMDDMYDIYSYSTAEEAGSGSDGAALTPGAINTGLSGDKIIYNYSATVETTTFDETLTNVEMLLSKYNAFVQTSYISGNSYGNKSHRSADYTLRVPIANFKGMTGSLSLLGNVINANTTSQNITAQFFDTQARLDTYRTEESRLLAMLGKADTVADMITIEQRLSDVRYQIESLTTTLRNWQNEIDFSTVTLRIVEVSELTEQVPTQRTYWERLRDGFNTTLKGIGEFFKSLFMGIVVALPVLLILAVIAIVSLVLIRMTHKKKNKNDNEESGPKQ